MSDALINSLETALATQPGDMALRAHLADLHEQAGNAERAWELATEGLRTAPADVDLLDVAVRAGSTIGAPETDGYRTVLAALRPGDGTASHSTTPPPPAPPAPPTPPSHATPPPAPVPVAGGYSPTPDSPDELFDMWDGTDAAPEPEIGEISRERIRLSDVGGMENVKQRLEMSFLAPMRNPEMQVAFGKSMRGGLLLWGPPGCGKTHIAKAVAGELEANFYHVGLSDVLDMWIGSSEKNITAMFEVARRNSPCVLFFDEVDAIGQKRTHLRGGGGAMRNVVNQLLQEMDGASSDNEGLFILAATNHPWDVDSALLRPGRLDRMLLVLPPDAPAREAILAHALRGKPVDRLDLPKLAKATDGLTGADLMLVIDQATEVAMVDSIDSGTIRPISMKDLLAAAKTVKPSHGPWTEAARNVALFSNDSGMYDDLLVWLKTKR